MKKILAAVLILVMALSLCPMSFAEREYPEPEKTYASLDDINLADYKLILVNYWEPWCGWCLEEMPDFEKLWQEYKDKGLLIVGMYHDAEDAEEAIEKTGITYPTINYDESSEYTQDGVPVSLFYDSEGNVLPAEVEEYVEALIGYVKSDIEAYLNGEYDKYTDEDSMAYKKDLDEIMDDEEKITDYCRSIAEGYIDDGGTFLGYSDYDTWKARIENRIA